MSYYDDHEFIEVVVKCRHATDEVVEFTGEEIIRCKECKKANTKGCSHSYWDDDWGVWRIGYKGDDWFCADGEREGE